MNDIEFNLLVKNIIFKNQESNFLQESKLWHDKSRDFNYQYLFEWCGRPIIQDPQDVLAINKIIWELNPNIIIETGVARGGSIMLSLSTMLSLKKFYNLNDDWMVVGIDLNLESDTSAILEKSGFKSNLKLISGSSVEENVVRQVKEISSPFKTKMFILDSNHTHQHVLHELMEYSSMTSPGDAILVLDTGIEFLPDHQDTHKLWRKGSNPFTAIQEFLAYKDNKKKFEIDDSHYYRNGLTCFRGGFLKKIAT